MPGAPFTLAHTFNNPRLAPGAHENCQTRGGAVEYACGPAKTLVFWVGLGLTPLSQEVCRRFTSIAAPPIWLKRVQHAPRLRPPPLPPLPMIIVTGPAALLLDLSLGGRAPSLVGGEGGGGVEQKQEPD